MEVVKQVLTSVGDMVDVENTYKSCPPLAAAFDTEADGLHIIKCKPFVIQFGWYSHVSDTIYAYAIDLTATPLWRAMVDRWYSLVRDAPVYLAHNIKFDLHMKANVGATYPYNNISDTSFYIRLAHDNISARQGGVRLGLKDYCSKWIDPKAKNHDQAIQAQRSNIAAFWNQMLKTQMGWTLGKVKDFFKDCTNTSEDFPTVQDYLNYCKWKESLPKELKHIHGKVEAEDVPYTMVDRTLLLDYALDDIVWVLRVFLKTDPVIESRGTRPALELENKCIRPLWEMEREGLPVDRKYVDESFVRMRHYIRRRRQDLKEMIGMEVTCNQHKKLAEYFTFMGIPLTSTGNDILNQIPKDYPGHPALETVKLIQELRTLEKWFTTYLMRFKDEDKIYTQINQVGAASLRMSSDFQQFPKKGLKDNEGQELFNPRRAITTDGNPTVYLDYSQIELRVQALYTILVGNPDTNLCRAYMPYDCVRNGDLYNFHDPASRATWHLDGWYLRESPETPWTPTDVHGATTKAAFGITEDDPMFDTLRNLGKRVNFAKNYGAMRNKIAEMFPGESEETINAIDQGYYKAFPGIKHYQAYCYEIGRFQPYATNLFGIRYWNVSGHNLINMLIQGSSATLLKEKIAALYEYIKSNNLKTKMIIPIHDEQQFSIPEDEMRIIPDLMNIMEEWEDSYVPIVVDAEITRTYWSEKEGM